MPSGLRWTEKKRQQIIDSIKKSRKRVKSGASCIFIPLTKTVGAKLYKTKAVRNKAHLLQAHASQFKLAPIAGDIFDLQCLCVEHDPNLDDDYEVKANIVYGYLTQMARVPKTLSTTCQISLGRMLDYKAGIRHSDLWAGNVGYINKRLVCIDFDIWSCRWAAGRKGGKDAKRA